MTTLLCYVPVVHRGYIDFFQSYPDAQICIWGDSLISREKSLRKEIRALSSHEIRVMLEAILRMEVQIAEYVDLEEIVTDAKLLVMPDDAVSRSLLGELLSMGLTSWEFKTVFLRWDSQSTISRSEVVPDETTTRESLSKLLEMAYSEASRSSDWWRQVGAVLFDDEGVYFSSHNEYLPTEYAPYISGDPRGSFSRGVNMDLSIAVHAEVQVIAMAARNGLKTKGLKLLTTTFPCPTCAKLIAACGISELIYCEGYSMVDGEQVLRDAGVKIVHVI